MPEDGEPLPLAEYVASRVALGATEVPEGAGTVNKLQPVCLIYRRQIVELPNVEMLDPAMVEHLDYRLAINEG